MAAACLGNKTNSFYSEDCLFILFTDTNVEEEMVVVGNKTNSFYSADCLFILFTQRASLWLECCVVWAGKSVVRLRELCFIRWQVCG